MDGSVPDPAPPSRRRYTVSAKVLAANRANLAKARAVPNAIRYRDTPRRRAACHANLLKAREATRAPDRPSPRGRFCHGLYNQSLRRSLIHAGESEAAFNAHLQLFVDAFGARNSDEIKLARALGEIVWRRWRALRCLSAWEAQSLYRRLASPPATPEAGAALAGDLFSLFYKAVGLQDSLHKLNRRFERGSRVFLTQRDGQVSDFHLMAPRLPGEIQMLLKPEPVLSNPFLTSRQVLQSLEPKPVRVAGIEQWQWKNAGGSRLCQGSPPEAHNAPRAILDFSQHFERFAAAFGMTPIEPPGPERGNGADGSESPEWAALERCAELAWRRLPLLAAQAEQERQALRQLLESSRGAGPRRLAEEVLKLLDGGKLFLVTFDLQERFQDELHALLGARFGPHPAFDTFKPDHSDRVDDFVNALLAAVFDAGPDDEPDGYGGAGRDPDEPLPPS